jgi:hypothetical protein
MPKVAAIARSRLILRGECIGSATKTVLAVICMSVGLSKVADADQLGRLGRRRQLWERTRPGQLELAVSDGPLSHAIH